MVKMNLAKLNLGWATLVPAESIENETTRKFISAIDHKSNAGYEANAYVCSDARLSGVRDFLTTGIAGIQGTRKKIKIYSSAGNVIEEPQEKLSLVIAHGIAGADGDYTGCGAVEYAKFLETSHGANSELPSIARLVRKNTRDNAEAQLQKVVEGKQGGKIYFDHSRGTVSIAEIHDGEYFGFMNTVFDSLSKQLMRRYSAEQLAEMSQGQNPEIIFLNNLNTSITGFETFRVDMQRDTIAGIARDSLCYAVSHALKGDGSFMSSATTVMAFDSSNHPKDLDDFLSNELFLRDYVRERGGSIYVVSLTPPRHHEIYKVSPR